MTYNYAVEGALLLLLLLGIYECLIKDPREIRVKVSFKERVRMISDMEIDLDEKSIGTSYLKKLRQFNMIRLSIFMILFVIFLMNIRANQIKIAGLVLFLIITTPRKSLFGVESPVKRTINSIKQKRAMELDDEIFAGAGTIKTLALLNSKGTFSADYIYEKLYEYSNKMRNIYASFLALYRGGNREEAFRFIRINVNTSTGKQFASILEKLEYLSPKEMVQQIEGFQEGIVEERMTRATNEIDRNSVITTLASTATIFAIILNFAIVGVFMDSLNMLNGIF